MIVRQCIAAAAMMSYVVKSSVHYNSDHYYHARLLHQHHGGEVTSTSISFGTCMYDDLLCFALLKAIISK